jgi:GMP reductase
MVKIEWDIKLGFQDVLIRPKRSKLRSRKDVKLVRTYKFLHSKHTWTGIPIVAANMDTTGTFEMAREFSKHKCMVAIHKHYTLTEWDNFIQKELSLNNLSIFNYIAVSAGTSDKDFIKLTKLLTTYKQLIFICLDIANGYSEHFVKYISKVRKSFTNHIIMAGNVVTQEMTEQLLLSGADIIKIGIGPGSVCTTRKKTGVGYPQLSAVLECADAAHGLGGLIVSDGGCTMPGDFGKAFGAGSDFVMAGGMFSGYDQSGGELIVDNNTGKKYKKFYGMSSSEAMKKTYWWCS